MISREIKCGTCGTEGKVQAHDTVGTTPPEQLFRLLGKDRSTGYIHVQCPTCSSDLAVDPVIMLSGGAVIGHGRNHRYVPIIFGLVFIAAGVFLAIGVGKWWSILLGALCLMFGWPSLKTGLFASPKEIAEMTNGGPASEETDRKFRDRL